MTKRYDEYLTQRIDKAMKEESPEKAKSLTDHAKRQRERQFKRALLKAWINGKFGSLEDVYMKRGNKRLYYKQFLSWYNKQNFEL